MTAPVFCLRAPAASPLWAAYAARLLEALGDQRWAPEALPKLAPGYPLLDALAWAEERGYARSTRALEGPGWWWQRTTQGKAWLASDEGQRWLHRDLGPAKDWSPSADD